VRWPRCRGGVFNDAVPNYVSRRLHKPHTRRRPQRLVSSFRLEPRVHRCPASVPAPPSPLASVTTAPRDVPARRSPDLLGGSLLIPSDACRRPASGPQYHAWAGQPRLPGRSRKGGPERSGGPPFLESPGVERNLGRRRGGGPLTSEINAWRSTRGLQHVEINTPAPNVCWGGLPRNGCVNRIDERTKECDIGRRIARAHRVTRRPLWSLKPTVVALVHDLVPPHDYAVQTPLDVLR
jgi:hypothetical protein